MASACPDIRQITGRTLLPLLAILLVVVAPAAEIPAETSDPLLLHGPTVLIEGRADLSQPAIQFDAEDNLYVAWFDHDKEKTRVRLAQLSMKETATPTFIQVNSDTQAPNAIHQSPGLAVANDGHIAVSWSTADRTVKEPFANHLVVAHASKPTLTFSSPAIVNDDSRPINHSFEDVLITTKHVAMTWLDGRHNDRSGASTIFSLSHDKGMTFQSNMTIDRMACPCCRPMMAEDPDGGIWVAWRKTFENNVRDIVVAQLDAGNNSFSSAVRVHEDLWSFSACPHRGPSIGFDRRGRMYVGWYTEGTDEQPRLYVATSDDQGRTFSTPVSLHTSTTSLPDHLRIAVHPSGTVVAVWEEVTGVRKRIVMRVSLDRGRNFGPVMTLSGQARAEHPSVAVHNDGRFAVGWTEHIWPNNRVIVRFGRLDRTSSPVTQTGAAQ